MAYELSRLQAPRVALSQFKPQDTTAKVNQALDKISAAVYKSSQRAQNENKLASIRQAESDLVRSVVNPDRMANDQHYAATVTRNTVNEEINNVMTALDDPTSEVSLMDPDEFQDYVDSRADEFYKGNTGKYAEVAAGVFNSQLLANQPRLTAKHAGLYRERIKNGQQDAAVGALSTINKDMKPGHYDKNVEVLLNNVLPDTMFTPGEQRQLIMTAATSSAMNGDRRLLDYAKNNLNMGSLEAPKVKIAEDRYRQWKKVDQENFWNTQYKYHEERAMSGEFTKADWDQLIVNKDAVDNFGRSQIDSWLANAGKSRHKAGQMESWVRQFRNMTPMVGTTTKDVDAVVDMEMAQGAATGQDPNAITEKIVQRLAAQNVVSNNIKDTMNSALGRPVWSEAVADNQQFQQTFTMAKMMSDYMTSDQMKRQMGEDAFDNFYYIDGELKYNGGDFKSAINALADATKKRKDMGKDAHLTSDEFKQLQESADRVFSGDVATSDPTVTKFLGWVSKADNALVTGVVKEDIKKVASRLVLRGFNPAMAIEQATRKIAANHGQFGGELHYTGGLHVGELFGFQSGTSEKTMDDGWAFYLKGLGMNPDDVAPVVSGGVVTVVNKETGEELPPVPASAIGDLWNAKELEDAQVKAAEDQANALENQSDAVELFHKQLYWRYGEDNGRVVFTQIQGKDVTINDFEKADLDTKSKYMRAWQDDFRTGERRFFKTLTTAGSFWSKAASSAVGWLKEHVSDLNIPGDEPLSLGIEAGEQPSTAGEAQAAEIPQDGEMLAQPMTKESQVVEDQIKKHEDFRGAPYKDSVGVETVGYGRNLKDNPITDAEWQALGGKRDLNKKPLTKEEATILFKNDLRRAQTAANNLYSASWSSLNQVRRDVLVDMAFNLGQTRLAKFTKMNKAIKAGDWGTAAKEMKNSKWFKQVGNRGSFLVNKMRSGK